jgi:uncharacterized protein YeaO (DUF488 family)
MTVMSGRENGQYNHYHHSFKQRYDAEVGSGRQRLLCLVDRTDSTTTTTTASNSDTTLKWDLVGNDCYV